MTDDQVQTLLTGMVEIAVALGGWAMVFVVFWWVFQQAIQLVFQLLDRDPIDRRTGKPKTRGFRRVVIARVLQDERERAWRQRVRRHAARVAKRGGRS